MNYQDNTLLRLKGLAFYLLILFFIVPTMMSAQESNEFIISPSGDTVIIKAIPILDINTKLEEVNTRLNKFPDVLKPNKDVVHLDSTLDYARELLDKEEARITQDEVFLTLRNVDDLKKQWEGYNDVLKKWNATLSDRLQELETNHFEATRIHKTWKKTEVSAREENVIKESLDRIQDIIGRVSIIENSLKKKQDSVLLYQNEITDFQIKVNQILLVINSKRTELQSEYFIQDSPMIWQANDSTSNVVSLKHQFSQSLKENYKQLNIFLEVNKGNWIFHIFLFIGLFILLLVLHRTFKIPENPENELTVANTLIVLRYYPASALLLALISSLFIYSGFPTSVREFIQILMLFPAIVLLRQMTDKKTYPIIIFLVLLFLVDEILFFFMGKSFFARILLLVEDAFLLWLIIWFVYKRKEIISGIKPNIQAAIHNFKFVYIFFIIVCLGANVLGFINLTTLINNAMISSILIAVLLYVLVIILDSLFYSLIATEFFRNSNILKYKGDIVLKNLHQIFKYFAYFMWVRTVLVSIGVADQLSLWLVGIFSYTWDVRGVAISFGGILAFFITILVTAGVTKFVRIILEEEVFPRIKLSRGVPGAISMMVRYTLVAFGGYVAITAAGIDLSKFGLIAGALGVGIGFGLQGVVYNFIAGLILAFERPIQKGDTIEIGTLMGDVMDIGVRSSTVRTYDGSEVIVPNGNLISNELINWTLSDRRRRSIIPVSVAYGSKPREVLKIIAKVAEDHPEVLDFPKPWPLFDGFGDSALNFRVLFWVDFDRRLSVTSEIAINIYDALEEADIHIPFPQHDLHIKSFDPTIQEVNLPWKEYPGKKTRGKKDPREKDEGA